MTHIRPDVVQAMWDQIALFRQRPVLQHLDRVARDRAPSAPQAYHFAWKLEPFVVGFHHDDLVR
ncbi:MAG TPA: hypothetical protein PK306_07065 [Aquabacterium sp.]|nr:hypothetical protein [Aquabacterium sp.]HQC95451.1 hypothetical protein [Aquabacterium sp.]